MRRDGHSKRLLGDVEETIVAGAKGGNEGGYTRLGFPISRRERIPKNSRTPAADIDHTNCIKSHSTLAREAKTMPTEGTLPITYIENLCPCP